MIYKGPKPFWVTQISHYTSSTGASEAITVIGKMADKSRMPGGRKRVYVPADKWKQNPTGCINLALWRSLDIKDRYDGSILVWNSRELLSKELLVKASAVLKKRGWSMYKNEHARRFVRRVIKLATTID